MTPQQDFKPGLPERVGETEIPVHRILGRNPGPMTGPGTNSYLLGAERLCLLDPGPVDSAQLQSFVDVIGGRQLIYILLTHTHRDHSPAAQPLAEQTGAEIVCLPAPDVLGQDHTARAARSWRHGDILELGEYTLELIHTPGHVSNHFCYLLREERLLFTGDHVLQGTTPVILPPDGDMADYLDSLSLLQQRDLLYLAPGHGGLMDDPQKEIAALIAHRLQREQKIVDCLAALGSATVDVLVEPVYDDVPAHLIPWAKKTLLAHLYKLQRDTRACVDEDIWRMIA